MDLYQLEASLVYTEFQPNQGYIVSKIIKKTVSLVVLLMGRRISVQQRGVKETLEGRNPKYDSGFQNPSRQTQEVCWKGACGWPGLRWESLWAVRWYEVTGAKVFSPGG